MEQDTNTNRPIPEEGITINLKKILLSCLKRWYWFVASVVLCIGLGILYIATTTPEFSVSSTLMLRTKPQNSMNSMLSQMNLSGITDITGVDMGMLTSELQVMNSKDLMRRAIEELDIQTNYYKKIKLCTWEQYPHQSVNIVYPPLFTDTLHRSIQIQIKRRNNDYKIKFQYGRWLRERYSVKHLSDGIQTPVGFITFVENQALEKGDLITIKTLPMADKIIQIQESIAATEGKNSSDILHYATVTSCPQKAITIINKLISLYNEETQNEKMLVAGITEQFIEERLQAISKELSEAEHNREQYKRNNKLTNLSAEAELFIQSSGEYQKQQAALETQLNLVEYIQDYIADNDKRYSLIPANLGITDPSLQKLIEEYNAALLKRMRLLRTTNIENPVIKQVENHLTLVKGNITQSINSVKEGIKISLNDAATKERQFAGRITNIPTQEREYIEIERLRRIKETVYIFLQQKQEENALNMMMAVPALRVVEQAQTDPAPVSPRILVILALCIVLGGILPAGVIIILYVLQDTVDGLEEYKTRLQAPIVGCIAKFKDKHCKSDIVCNTFSYIGNNLLYHLNHSDGKEGIVLQITSSIKGEGKTFIAARLATAIAGSGKKVAIVDFDITNPQQAAEWNMVGSDTLSTFLNNPATPLNVHPTDTTLVDLLPLNKGAANTDQWFANGQVDQLFKQLRQQYDYIIVDSGAISSNHIALRINQYANATLYISRVDFTPRKYTSTINDLYARKRLNNLMCVLNGTNNKEFTI